MHLATAPRLGLSGPQDRLHQTRRARLYDYERERWPRGVGAFPSQLLFALSGLSHFAGTRGSGAVTAVYTESVGLAEPRAVECNNL